MYLVVGLVFAAVFDVRLHLSLDGYGANRKQGHAILPKERSASSRFVIGIEPQA